ncbi:MAG TPA: trehalose-phosphatase [Deltaproteobacteria bacterium]|nr:trehalose-phosphatase [Deltaproteobacteria bacterium]
MRFEEQQTVCIHAIPDFWDRLIHARETLLGLDYDGTLAPFHEDRMDAVPYPGIPPVLKEIRRTTVTEVVIISGRPLSELSSLMGNVGCLLIGSHGFESLSPDGHRDWRNPDDLQKRGLALAKKLGTMDVPGERLEAKIASVAIHTRGLPPDQARRIEERIWTRWKEIGDAYDLEPKRFNGGVELRSRGWDKGNVVRSLLRARPSDIFAVYIGDDETDEDAFSVIRDRGVGIKVGLPIRATAAQGFLADSSQVKLFLEKWLRKAPCRIQGES